MRHEKPPQVRKDMLEGSTEALRNRGRKGNSHKLQLEDFRAAEKKEEEKRLAEEQAKLISISEEGDVLPPEPDILSTLPDKPPKSH